MHASMASVFVIPPPQTNLLIDGGSHRGSVACSVFVPLPLSLARCQSSFVQTLQCYCWLGVRVVNGISRNFSQYSENMVIIDH